MKDACVISVIVPVYNEHESIVPLTDRLLNVLESFSSSEVIFVNDGSRDGTKEVLDEVFEAHRETVRVIHLKSNAGKALALQIGFENASGELVAMMDGDLQDQPEELPKMASVLKEENVDAVNGWKVDRKDNIDKTLPSKAFNFILRRMSGLQFNDFNSGIKLFRRECLENICLYGEQHRFLLHFVAADGYSIKEIPVEHAARQFGETKYRRYRIFQGLMDIISVYFITRFVYSPLHFFGYYGLITTFIGTVIGCFYVTGHFYALLAESPEWHLSVHPLWMISPVLILLGLLMIFIGLIGEMITCHAVRRDKSTMTPFRKIGFVTSRPNHGSENREA
jgi:glycosyltransferase involved in cell wall biosynthesis